jgi:actin-like ATPase involved in cell morphogenesis
MRFRSSVAIDLGTVNTLVWVAGRGIVLDEPTAIAIDTAVGKVAAVGEAAEIWPTRNRRTSRSSTRCGTA